MRRSPVMPDRLARLGLAARLNLGFGLGVVLAVAVGAVGLVGLNQVGNRTGELSGRWLPGVAQLAAGRAAVLEARDHEIRHSRTSDRSYHAEYEEKITAALKTVETELGAYAAKASDEEAAQRLADFRKAWTAYLQAQQKVLQLGRGGQQQDAADISDGAASMHAEEALAALEQL